jgi:hypothetical protein
MSANAGWPPPLVGGGWLGRSNAQAAGWCLCVADPSEP